MGDPDTDFVHLYWVFGVKFLEDSASTYGHDNIELLRSKVDDHCLLFMLFLIAYARKFGDEEAEVAAWEELANRFGGSD